MNIFNPGDIFKKSLCILFKFSQSANLRCVRRYIKKIDIFVFIMRYFVFLISLQLRCSHPDINTPVF